MELGDPVGDLSSYARAWIFELTGADADRYVDQDLSQPAGCVQIQIDGRAGGVDGGRAADRAGASEATLLQFAHQTRNLMQKNLKTG